MVCVFCGAKTRVANSRRQVRNNQVWRRRVCQRCGDVFTSLEYANLETSYRVSRKGLIEPLSSDKLYTEVLLALQDRKNCYVEAREITSTVLKKLLDQQVNPIEASSISQATASVLRRFNKRAWLRYAAEHPSVKA